MRARTALSLRAVGLLVWLAFSMPAAGADWNVSLSGSAFQPWYGDVGQGGIASAQVELREGRFWIGIEVEYRAFDANLGGGFGPDYESVLARGLFHYHPFPDAALSPYVGLATGIALHLSDRDDVVNGEERPIRRRASGGTTLLGLAGVQAPVPGVRGLFLFVEGRVETAGDLWKKRGGNWQYDQVGGVTGTGGLRVRF